MSRTCTFIHKDRKNGCADGQKKHTYRRKTFINIDRRNMYKRIDRQPRDIPADILTDKRMYTGSHS